METSVEVKAEIERLQKRLSDLKEQERKDHLEAQARVKPVWRFTLEPRPSDSFTKIYDPSVVIYRLSGVVVNEEELKAVHKEIRNGSMSYLYNTLSKRFITPVGGGSLFIVDDTWGNKPKNRETREMTFACLEFFLSEHPEGGDVTGIIVNQDDWNWGK